MDCPEKYDSWWENYSIPKKSKLASQILASKIGVVWHTTYRGDSLETMRASLGKEIASTLKKNKNVWSVDAVYKDVSGLATFTQKETEAVTKILSQAGKIFSGLKRETIDGIHKNEELRLRVNTFVNAKVREGQRITNPSRFVNELVDYIMGYYKKQEDARKSERGKQAQREKSKEVLKYFSVVDKREIVRLFELYNLIVDAKLMIVRKLDTAKRINTLLLTPNGYEVTEQEGFVAIDRTGKNAVKLIDRLQFSRANFSADIIKGWQR